MTGSISFKCAVRRAIDRSEMTDVLSNNVSLSCLDGVAHASPIGRSSV